MLQKFSVSIDFEADVDFILIMISDISRLKLCYQYILKYVAYFVSSDCKQRPDVMLYHS